MEIQVRQKAEASSNLRRTIHWCSIDYLWLGRVNEPRNAKESGLRPEGTGDFEVLHARKVTRSDLHFGKVSLSWERRLDCRVQTDGVTQEDGRLRGGHREGKTGLHQAIWELKAQSETLDQAAKKLRAPSLGLGGGAGLGKGTRCSGCQQQRVRANLSDAAVTRNPPQLLMAQNHPETPTASTLHFWGVGGSLEFNHGSRNATCIQLNKP